MENSLAPPDRPARNHPHASAWPWLIAFGVMVILYCVLYNLNNSTELLPTHDNADDACYIIAIFCGLVFGFVGFRMNSSTVLFARIWTAFFSLLFGLLTGFMFSFEAATVIETRIDFPPAKTITYPALLSIGRAYHTHGKGQSWNIQTTPVWSNMEITETDYQFMQSHRPTTDTRRDPDEIASHGYLCARVTLQQSGNAYRVMHAGNLTLPEGTIIVCPSKGPVS